MKKTVQGAENKVRKSGSLITAGRIIAELSFGFWVTIFQPEYFRFLGSPLMKVFRNKPSGVNRSAIHTKLDGIRRFRNRVYHNEPICFITNKSTIDFHYPKRILQDIFDVLSWMDPELKEYIEGLDGIQRQLKRGDRFRRKIRFIKKNKDRWEKIKTSVTQKRV